MDPKWPLNLDVTPDAIRAKVEELLARDGEWTPMWIHGLERIREEADEIARIVATMRFEPVDERAALTRMGLALGRGLTADMVEDVVAPDELTVDNWIGKALLVATMMAADIVEGIARTPMDDIDRIVPGDPRDLVADVIGAISAEWDEARRVGIAAAVEALGREPRGQGGHDILAKALARKEAEGHRRGIARIATAVDASIENYGVPERLMPRLHHRDDKALTVEYHWGVGLPIGDEPALGKDDPRAARRPNGMFRVSYGINTIGDIAAYQISRIAAEVQRIVLIAGRDVEIDGYGAPIDQPPPWCIAGALPLNLLVLAEPKIKPKQFEMAGGIATCRGTAIGDSGLAEMTSDPLLGGTTVTYYGELPDTLRLALTRETGMPMRRIVSHAAFEDDRIVIRRTEVRGDGAVTFHLDCPVERLVPAPNLELEQDPIAAWSDYGGRVLVDEFYSGVERGDATVN